jgi:ketosteroid isomerase-like protein
VRTWSPFSLDPIEAGPSERRSGISENSTKACLIDEGIAFSEVRAKAAEAQGYACCITKELKVMKCVLCLLVMLVGPLHVYTPSQQTMQITQASSVEQEIVKLEQDWVEALRSGDTNFIQKLRADDFIYINSSGKVLNKAQLEAIEKASGTSRSARIPLTEIPKVQVYSSTAIATGWIRFEEPTRNSEFVFEYRFMHVWVKSNAGWQVVAAQYTNIGRGISLGPV